MTARATTEQGRAAIKSALRRLVRGLGGQAEAAAATRVSQPQISRYTSQSHPDEHIPLDVLMDLTIDGGDPAVIRTLCRQANGVFVPLPETQAELTNWPEALGAAVQRGADAAAAICTALSDDSRISRQEIVDLEITGKLSHAIEALIVLQSHAKSVLEQEAES
jgi:hypothetical protein